jgi:Flp pilus assembly protein TadG
MRDFITAFRRDTGANAAILFACALPALLAATGAALDYGRASRIRTKLLAAADTASIAAIAKTSSAMTTASTMSSDGPISAGVTDALTFFNAQIAGQTGFTVGTLSAAVAKSGSAVTSNLNFTATVPTVFMGAFGFRSITVGGASTAANNLPVFLDFYLLLDNTPSMGVGATPADVSTMVANTSDQCAFACHDLSDSNSYYKLAKKLGVTMRIDVLRTATQQLMDTAAATETYSNQFRMAIYDFGASEIGRASCRERV